MGAFDHSGPYSMGSLQQAINRIIEEESMLTVDSVWQAFRHTCAWTDDELVGHAALLGAEFVKHQSMWEARGSGARHFDISVTAWRWLMDNHRFVLEEEYNVRHQQRRDHSHGHLGDKHG